MDKIIIEIATKSKFLSIESEDNGHDCWGNYESSTYKCIYVDGKLSRTSDEYCVIHDEKKVLDHKLIFLLPDSIRVYLDDDLAEKEKEKRRLRYLELKKEFES